jgi:RNA polymerase sigma-70 factor (ECF subfamily)
MERARFDRVLRDHRDRIYAHALRCLRDPDDAADLTQEVFLRLWRRGPDWPEDDRVAAWLTRVTHNLIVDRSRRARAWERHVGRPDPDALGELAAGPHPRPRSLGDAAALAGAGAGVVPQEGPSDELAAALAHLAPEARSLILMHYWQGLKLREIAAVLAVSENTLKVRLHRARKALRAVLDPGAAVSLAAGEEPSP